MDGWMDGWGGGGKKEEYRMKVSGWLVDLAS